MLGDIEQIIYQVKVKGTDKDTLRFYGEIHLIKLSVIAKWQTYLFGKTDPPSCSNFALEMF